MPMAEEGEGKEVTVVLVAWDERLDILPKGPAETLKSLSQTVGDLIHKQSDSCPRELFEIKACLERFDAFLLQSARLLKYLDLERLFSFPITVEPPGIPAVSTLRDLSVGEAMGVAAEDACTDFESLLFSCSSPT